MKFFNRDSSSFNINQSTSCALDLLRGLSAQAVLFGHGISFVGIWDFLSPPHAPYIQNIAVSVFFFLSGFLISHTTLRKNLEKNYKFEDYFIERFSRIYSAFIPSLFFVLIVDFLAILLGQEKYGHHSAFNVKTFLGNIFMLQDFPFYFKNITSFGSARPFWTLAIEWWLYMSFGWAILIKPKSVLGWSFKLLVMIPFLVVPIYNFAGRGNGLTFVWIWGVLASIMVPRLVGFKWLRMRYLVMAATLLSVLAISKLLRTGSPYNFKFGILMSASIFFWITYLQMSHLKAPRWLKNNAHNLASFSFTLYLIHYSISDFINNYLKDHIAPFAIFSLIFMLSNLISWFISKYSELKHRELTIWLKRILNHNKMKVAKPFDKFFTSA